MLSQSHKEPKISPCLILIQESPENYLAVALETYLIQTAVEKYHIGLGQDYQNFSFLNPYYGEIENVTNPVIQIDKHGLTALKCPTVWGGKWFKGIDFSLCRGKDALNMESWNLNIFFEIMDSTWHNFFWVFLIIVKTLKCDFKAYWPGYKNVSNRVDLSKSQILLLKNFPSFDMVKKFFITLEF